MGLRPQIIKYDPMFVFHFPTSQVDFGAGDMVVLQSNAIVLMDDPTESTDFIGIAGGTENLNTVPVYLRCVAKMNLIEAAYTFGAGLKYSGRETLVADGDANTIGWFFEPAVTTDIGNVFFSVPDLYNNNWDAVS